MSSKAADLTGLRFGKLVVLGRAESDCNGNPRWRCRCDCGQEKVVYGISLRGGHAQSCGAAGCRLRKGEPKIIAKPEPAPEPEPPKPAYMPPRLTLCWGCKNATGGCSWSARLEPVPGWDAVTTAIKCSGVPAQSYHVRACPLFEAD